MKRGERFPRGYFFYSLTMLFVSLLLPELAQGRTWRIEADGTGDAPTIQAGVDSASSGDIVLLGAGSYTWTSHAGTPHSMVVLKSGVTLRGESGPEATVLDAEFRGRPVFVPSLSESVQIEGVTVQNGSPNTSPGQSFLFGGGICADAYSSVVISHCIVQRNRIGGIQLGGGIFCWEATIEHCKILNNTGGLDAAGIGIYARDLTVRHCEVSGNSVSGDASASNAAIAATNSGTIADCLIRDNSVRGVFGGGTAGIGAKDATITRCVFINNTVDISDGPAGSAALGTRNGIVRDCIFIGNEARSGTSVVNGIVRANLGSQIINCTVVGNRAISLAGHRATAGVVFSDGGELRSSVIAFNQGEATASFDAPASLFCNNIFGNSVDNIAGVDGGGNFSLDPEFCAVDPVGSSNVSIQEDSPCKPGNHPDGTACGTIGAGDVACGRVNVKESSWSQIKGLYRR